MSTNETTRLDVSVCFRGKSGLAKAVKWVEGRPIDMYQDKKIYYIKDKSIIVTDGDITKATVVYIIG